MKIGNLKFIFIYIILASCAVTNQHGGGNSVVRYYNEDRSLSLELYPDSVFYKYTNGITRGRICTGCYTIYENTIIFRTKCNLDNYNELDSVHNFLSTDENIYCDSLVVALSYGDSIIYNKFIYIREK